MNLTQLMVKIITCGARRGGGGGWVGVLRFGLIGNVPPAAVGPIPMFRGNVSKRVPMFRDFCEKKYPLFAI